MSEEEREDTRHIRNYSCGCILSCSCSYVEEDGEVRYYGGNGGKQLHRANGPAIEYPDGSQAWFINGVKHRTEGPAYIGADGKEEWWVKGAKVENHSPQNSIWYRHWYFLLNLDSQAVLKEYLVNGVRHNEDGHALMYFNGTRCWYLKGALHREDGPALLFQDGRGLWFRNGLAHREDGPAITYHNDKQEWWIEGVEYTKEEFDQYIARKQLKDSLQIELQEGKSKRKMKV